MWLAPIRSYTDQTFYLQFEQDLGLCKRKLVILSPFISERGTRRYFGDFQRLLGNSCSIEIYLKPHSEQPKSLQSHFHRLVPQLKEFGIEVHLRPKMHEKIVVIDEEITWHGSLNVLSHNETRESMFRLESPEVATSLIEDLNLYSTSAEDSLFEAAEPLENNYTPSQPTSPECPECGQEMAFYDNIGRWICKHSPQCDGTLVEPPSTSTDQPSSREKSPISIDLDCPLCRSPLVYIRGSVINRVQCSHQDCNFALDPSLSRPIIRLYRKRGPS